MSMEGAKETKEPYKDRLFKEYSDLDIKIKKLTRALNDPDFKSKVGAKKFKLMRKQRKAMIKYINILAKRCELEHLHVCSLAC